MLGPAHLPLTARLSRASLDKSRVIRVLRVLSPLKTAFVKGIGEDPAGPKRIAVFWAQVPSIRKVYFLNSACVAASSLTTSLAALDNV